jgi:hypothetical protein
MITFDHWRLVKRNPRELRKFRSWVLSARPGEISRVRVAHEANGKCCRKEEWDTTARTIVEGLQPNVPTVMVNVNDPEAV